MAFPMELSRTSLRNGFVKNSRAPAFMARTVVGTSAQAVMNMVGISIRSETSCCRSRPLRSGSITSNTKQLGVRTRGRDRNSSAEANVSARQPALWTNNSSDSRTVASSSTTNTIGGALGVPSTTSVGESFFLWILDGCTVALIGQISLRFTEGLLLQAAAKIDASRASHSAAIHSPLRYLRKGPGEMRVGP